MLNLIVFVSKNKSELNKVSKFHFIFYTDIHNKKEIIHVCIIDSFELHRIIKFSARFIMFFSGHWWCHLSCYLVKEKSLIMARKLACPVRFPIGTVLQPSKLSWGRERQSIRGEHYEIENFIQFRNTMRELWLFPNYK